MTEVVHLSVNPLAPASPIIEEVECVLRQLPKQEQNVTRIRYFVKNSDKEAHEEIRPLTGSKWNLVPSSSTNKEDNGALKTNLYRTFDNQPIWKVMSIISVL